MKYMIEGIHEKITEKERRKRLLRSKEATDGIDKWMKRNRD